jgi:hypothetical protein
MAPRSGSQLDTVALQPGTLCAARRALYYQSFGHDKLDGRPARVWGKCRRLYLREAEEAAVYQLWQLLVANKIRVFSSLAGFLAAYRTRDEEALLLGCERFKKPAQSEWLGVEYSGTKQKPNSI